MNNALETRKVSKVYGTGTNVTRAVDAVSLQVQQGEFLALVGPSGSGKTTMLSMLAALLTPSEGQIMIDGQDLAEMSDAQRTKFRREKIGFTFQANNLLPFLTARENVELMLRLNQTYNKEGARRVTELLERLGLGDRMHNLPRQLSGGQQQRVAIARALVHNPAVVLADEPTAALDTERAHQVVRTFADLIHEQKRAGIMVTHDLRMAQYADRVVQMMDGRIAREYSKRSEIDALGQQDKLHDAPAASPATEDIQGAKRGAAARGCAGIDNTGMQRIIWWLRRDLRLTDNVVLHQALNDGAAVIPVFILDPILLDSDKLAPARKQFLFESLGELDANLKKRGSYLVVRRGAAGRELLKLVRETQADAVYFHADYTPYARKRDAKVKAALEGMGIRHASFNDIYLADPDQVTKADGTPYTVFSPYRKRFESVIAIPERYATRKPMNTPPDIKTLALDSVVAARGSARTPGITSPMPGGEAAGKKLARDFVARRNGLSAYGDSRNDMGADATSHLSPHLHFGTVSVRELVRMAREVFETPTRRRQAGGSMRNPGANAKVWVDELVWREFFNQVLYHFPHAARGAFRSNYANLRWENDAEWLAAWSEGRTGYPLVDAGMRELNATGWMHNRARMVTASFLTKDLLLNWQAGEAYFLQHLVDGDIASNNGGWQWAAGTGTDAQPYFRIFNPVLQGTRFDPAGSYVRRWVPELAQVPDKYIHAPWELPAEIGRKIGFTPGKSYPKPIIDHAVQRERALALYRQSAARRDDLSDKARITHRWS